MTTNRCFQRLSDVRVPVIEYAWRGALQSNDTHCPGTLSLVVPLITQGHASNPQFRAALATGQPTAPRDASGTHIPTRELDECEHVRSAAATTTTRYRECIYPAGLKPSISHRCLDGECTHGTHVLERGRPSTILWNPPSEAAHPQGFTAELRRATTFVQLPHQHPPTLEFNNDSPAATRIQPFQA